MLRERSGARNSSSDGDSGEKKAARRISSDFRGEAFMPSHSAWDERYEIVLLLLLYTAQGLPMGLIFGSLPFLLKSNARVTFADLGIFSLCSMPYALKLLIAPVVDGGRPPLPLLGRRRGWIVPPLAVAGALLVTVADQIAAWVGEGRVRPLTALCFLVIAFTAVQDVAVDGWSLELLSEKNVAYASTCQSLGTSLGYLGTFTVFLALNDAAFCAKYLWPWLSAGRVGAAVSLVTAIRGVGAAFLIVAAAVALMSTRGGCETQFSEYDFKQSGSLVDQEAHLRVSKEAMNSSVISAYRALLRILRLRPVQSLVICLLLAKVGFSAHDSATALKLIDLGFPKETLASIAMIQAPIQLLGTVAVGRWAAQGSPEVPYLVGYAMRVLFSMAGPLMVRMFSAMNGSLSTRFYMTVVAFSVVYGLASDCLMFVSIGAFFLRITSASTSIGGSYLTLLYAAQNMGGMWHRSITLALIEQLTTRKKCILSETLTACPIETDGYFVISAFLAVLALVLGLYQYRTMRRLGKLPVDVWKPCPA